MSFSPRLLEMMKRGTRGLGLDPFDPEQEEDLDRLDEESQVVQTVAAFRAMGYAVSPAIEDFARRFAFRRYAVRGDGAPRFLVLGGKAIDYDGGQVVQCLEQPAARATICLHASGAIYDAGGRLVAGRALEHLAGSLDHYLEYEAALDALADEGKRWFRLGLRVPEGTTRVLAERLSLSPLEEVNDRGLGAWRRPGFLLRARRLPGFDPPWQLDACAADAPSADDFASLCMELLEKSPSRQLWNPV